jgi:hypothetical protein
MQRERIGTDEHYSNSCSASRLEQLSITATVAAPADENS